MGDVAISDESKTKLHWIETVFGLLCDDKSRYVLLCSGKWGLMMQRVSKELQRLLHAGPWPVYVQVKGPREIRRIIMMEHEAEESDDDSDDAASDDDSDDAASDDDSDDAAEDDMLPDDVAEAWLYVLFALKKLDHREEKGRVQITGLDLSAMGKCNNVEYYLRDVLVSLVEAHSKWLEELNLNGIEMRASVYDLFVVDQVVERVRAPLGPLAKCTSLTHLDLSDPFGAMDHGMRYFVRVLPKLTSLRTLIMRRSRIGYPGAKLLAGVLDKCPSVSYVDVSGNLLSPAGERVLQAAFRKRDASHQLIM